MGWYGAWARNNFGWKHVDKEQIDNMMKTYLNYIRRIQLKKCSVTK